MGTTFTRPRVEELIFRLYDRPVHPEFLSTLAWRQVRHDAYRVSVRITPTGHALTWSDGHTHLTEVTATRDQELPERGGRFTQRFQGEQARQCEIAKGLRYWINLQVECLPCELFQHYQQELVDYGREKGLVFGHAACLRFGPGPVSIVIAQALRDCLSVCTFHTFPDELSVIKTQSLIEWC